MLEGHLGLTKAPPSWLNEMVPEQGRFYSVFPLGAVLSMMPVAALQKTKLIEEFPGGVVASVIVGICVFFGFQLSIFARRTPLKSAFLSFAFVFGTWFWCNLGFAGAWQIALGFAVAGELGALYFTLVERRPFLAGCFAALAFGNRTELIVTLPIYLWLLLSPNEWQIKSRAEIWPRLRRQWRAIARFIVVPVILAGLTAGYNYARFGSIFDFGYARIPRLLNEPWYKNGLFALQAIPWNVYKMLFEGFRNLPQFPFITFAPFGCSIFLASPLLMLIFRERGKHRWLCWITIALLTFVLWAHGNPGGWQFSYRYASELLPWMFLLLLENGPARLTATEVTLGVVSVALNAVATYQFIWTKMIHS